MLRGMQQSFGAVKVFVSAYLSATNIMYQSVKFCQQNIILQWLCLAVISQSLEDYEKSHPYVGKQMGGGRRRPGTQLSTLAAPESASQQCLGNLQNLSNCHAVILVCHCVFTFFASNLCPAIHTHTHTLRHAAIVRV